MKRIQSQYKRYKNITSCSQSKNWTIRHNIKPGDIGYLIYLHGIVYAKEYGYDQTFEAYVAKGLAEFVQSFSLDNDGIWLAEINGQVIGSIAIEKHSEKEAQLHWFFVHPNYRGLGLGKELMNEALQFCKKREYKTIFLWTTSELEAASHLYTHFGFKKTEEKAHKIWGKDLVEERYELDL